MDGLETRVEFYYASSFLGTSPVYGLRICSGGGITRAYSELLMGLSISSTAPRFLTWKMWMALLYFVLSLCREQGYQCCGLLANGSVVFSSGSVRSFFVFEPSYISLEGFLKLASLCLVSYIWSGVGRGTDDLQVKTSRMKLLRDST